MPAVWYRRTFTILEAERNGKILLRFVAVDYHATVYINGRQVGEHHGGFTAFTLDIGLACVIGENVLTVCAEDDSRDNRIPIGKQSPYYQSKDCVYTRTTGIWQTVWLEFVPFDYISSFRLYPDAENGSLRVSAQLNGKGTLRAEASYQGKPMGFAKKAANSGVCDLEIPLAETHLWEAGNGRLYDLALTFGEDRVESYFGLRSISFDGMKFCLNGKPVFQRFVLDQGFYPDGIYTAPTEDALIRDITLSQALGFNGARLHEKVFEPLFLYHCDRLGYMVWGEYPNWGLTDALLDNEKIFHLCYTQLYDIEQEQNGLYTYERKPKFDDMDFFRRVLSRPAKIEE